MTGRAAGRAAYAVLAVAGTGGVRGAVVLGLQVMLDK